jgi:Uma2 family endonuclease
MPFVINDANLPATLTAQPMIDEAFAAFCAEHSDLHFETTADGQIIVMPPTHSETGASSFDVAGELHHWAKKDGRGIGCDSSTGFVLPSGARKSPDASRTPKSRVRKLGKGKCRSYWLLCPDFVIEVRSDTDRLKPLQAKMREYLEQGAQFGITDRSG